MRAIQRLFLLAVVVASTTVAAKLTSASEPNCSQTLVDGTTAPATTYYIYPAQSVVPFYQWENNNGYCGECH